MRMGRETQGKEPELANAREGKDVPGLVALNRRARDGIGSLVKTH